MPWNQTKPKSTGGTIPGQNGPGSNGNDRVLHILSMTLGCVWNDDRRWLRSIQDQAPLRHHCDDTCSFRSDFYLLRPKTIWNWNKNYPGFYDKSGSVLVYIFTPDFCFLTILMRFFLLSLKRFFIAQKNPFPINIFHQVLLRLFKEKNIK